MGEHDWCRPTVAEYAPSQMRMPVSSSPSIATKAVDTDNVFLFVFVVIRCGFQQLQPPRRKARMALVWSYTG